MAFRPVQMEKIRIICVRDRAHDVLTILHDLRVVQVEETGQEVKEFLKESNIMPRRDEVIERLTAFRSFENLLPHRKVTGRRKFESLEEILDAASRIKIDHDVKVAYESMEQLKVNMKDVSNRIEILSYLKDMELEMDWLSNSTVSSYIIKGQHSTSLKDAVTIKGNGFTILTVPNGMEKEVAKEFNGLSEKPIYVPPMHGVPKHKLAELEQIRKDDQANIDKVMKGLDSLSEKYYADITAIREALEIEAKKYEVAMKMPSSGSISVLEGWIPQDRLEMAQKLIDEQTSGLSITEKLETDERGPTLQRNPTGFRLFESFIRFYSIPQTGEVDPTIIFAIAFPIFFGIMVGDFGFGIVILLLSIWIVRRINGTGKKVKLPRSLTGFVSSIFTPYQLQILARALIPGSIVAIITGVIFDSFFGFKVLPTTIGPFHMTYFDPLVYTSKILLMSGYFGVIMVSFGLIIGMFNEYLYGEIKHMLGKFGWLMFVWGVVIYGLSLIYSLNTSLTTNIFADIDIAVILAGIILIVMSEKAQGIIELPSVISHVLSYTRIMGILLASVIITQLINQFFLSTTSNIALAVIGVFMLVFGQLFALVLALVEGGIQGVRLIYVEFFSKFYRGNGRMFTPFGTHRKYTEEKYKA